MDAFYDHNFLYYWREIVRYFLKSLVREREESLLIVSNDNELFFYATLERIDRREDVKEPSTSVGRITGEVA